jgi:hypothetical protein
MKDFTKEELDFIIAACKQCLATTDISGIASDFLLDLMVKCKEATKNKSH